MSSGSGRKSTTMPVEGSGHAAARTRVIVAITLLLVLAVGTPSFERSAGAHRLDLTAARVGTTETPAPPPARPQINPVAPNDDAVVRPDDTVNGDAAAGTGVDSDVRGLPASGTGYAVPADGDLQRWTGVAVGALALNALALFVVALWSLRRRRPVQS